MHVRKYICSVCSILVVKSSARFLDKNIFVVWSGILPQVKERVSMSKLISELRQRKIIDNRQTDRQINLN